MAGRTMTAIVAAIPPAVCRMIAPRARPSWVQTHSTRPAARTLPGTPGAPSDTPRPGPDKMAWDRKNEANTTTSPTASATAPRTTALAASTARRRGAAANVVRMSPVLNSELNASTPSTHTAITAYSRLSTAGRSGSGAGPEPLALEKAKATRELAATGLTTATSRTQKVERTERNLVHSDASRSRARTAIEGTGRSGAMTGAGPVGGTVVAEVMGSSFPRGIRCSRR